jgi:hypothetical protein
MSTLDDMAFVSANEPLGLPADSDRTITADLMARLERHYIKPGAPLPGGVFVPEVGQNGSWGAGRRCDAIYVGFTSSSGRLLVGHEVKASRADWLHELAQPGKADTWADQCHEWWLVTAPGVVHDGELPAGWGHMVPSASRTRMRVVTRARRKPDSHKPAWDAVRSVLARQDTLRAQTIADQVQRSKDRLRADHERSVQARVDGLMASRPDATDLQERLAAIETALGAQIVHEPERGWVYRPTQASTVDLADVATLLRVHGDLQTAAAALTGRYSGHELTHLRRTLDALDAAREAAIAALQARP